MGQSVALRVDSAADCRSREEWAGVGRVGAGEGRLEVTI